MFKKFFNKKKSKESPEEKNILIASLLVHAAKMDESYTDIEKKIIKKALINLNGISLSQADDIVTKAEKKRK